MKKILLIALMGTVFAATAAFACDTCAKHTKSADGSKMVCSADCDKPCCADKKKECCGTDGKCCAEKKACCGEGGKCCHEGHSHDKKAACAAECDKPCCADKKATATKTEAAAPCCSAVLGKAA